MALKHYWKELEEANLLIMLNLIGIKMLLFPDKPEWRLPASHSKGIVPGTGSGGRGVCEGTPPMGRVGSNMKGSLGGQHGSLVSLPNIAVGYLTSYIVTTFAGGKCLQPDTPVSVMDWSIHRSIEERLLAEPSTGLWLGHGPLTRMLAVYWLMPC